MIGQQLSVKPQLLSEISPSEMKQLDLRNWGMHYISVSENAMLLAQKYLFNRYLKFTTHIREIKFKSRQQTINGMKLSKEAHSAELNWPMSLK